MYDFFFTKYAAIYYGDKHVPLFSLLMSLSSAICISATAAVTASGLLRVRSNNSPDESVIMDSTTADIIITVAILISIALLEVTQLLHYQKTIWARVASACQRVIREEATNTAGNKDTFDDPVGSVAKDYHHEVKLGQYSLLDSSRNFPHGSTGLQKRILSSVTLYAAAFGNPRALHNKRVDARLQSVFEPGKSTKLTASVKEAVVQSLECSAAGNLTNGQSSLEHNGAHHLFIRDFIHSVHPHSGTSWSWKEENQVYVILTWHIATCHCEETASEGAKLLKDFEVVTKLSKYCAYLVVAQPKLLPGHHYDTRCVFEAVAAEAIRFFIIRKKKKDKDTRSKVTEHPESKEPTKSSESKETIFRKGMRLGHNLERMDEGRCWKLLANFWAELVLYIAPSDNVKEHIECLAKGGEFLTYLWALLTHAGILDRNQTTTDDIENAGDYQRFQRARSCPLTRAEKRTYPATFAATKPPTSANYMEFSEICVEDARTATSTQGCGNDEITGPSA